MKNFYYAIPVALLVTAVSCKKESGSNNNPGGGKDAKLLRIQQGVSADDDTVYLVKYDAQSRISTIIDSIYMDTLTATYDGSGNITVINERSEWSNDATSVTYDGSGHPTQIDYTLFGEKGRYVFEYAGALPSKYSYYTDAGQGGSYQLWRTFAYTVTGSNITGIKEYDKNGTLLGERKIAFGTQANPFKKIAFFNWGNRLGLEDIIPMETMFNANIATSTGWFNATQDPFYTTTVVANNNSSGAPVGITATEKDPGGDVNNLFTWSFSY